MKTRVTGVVTGTTPHVILRENDIMIGAMLNGTDGTLKKTGIKIALTSVMTAVTGIRPVPVLTETKLDRGLTRTN
jgi:hypothetical protein